ncbi:hypothetical protein PROFUN_11816 [Planoprotostelium fungivorum]|uniref:Uncharacterized protein n=1 Tax=Planoprotostelium fungivorum TaxID=1890364 RepID=A0A2P6MRI2_9EUKA|nr:hypothetical protein PROFUN_11816 [Planoprotostelium fungivorum]
MNNTNILWRVKATPRFTASSFRARMIPPYWDPCSDSLLENSATKKHIQCTFIERELLGFLWYEIILYKQRLIELFGSYVNPLARVITATTSLARVITTTTFLARVITTTTSLARVITTTTSLARRNLRENSATKKHIQCTFIERELLGFLWYEIILYKQRLIELFGSYVVTIHHTHILEHLGQLYHWAKLRRPVEQRWQSGNIFRGDLSGSGDEEDVPAVGSNVRCRGSERNSSQLSGSWDTKIWTDLSWFLLPRCLAMDEVRNELLAGTYQLLETVMFNGEPKKRYTSFELDESQQWITKEASTHDIIQPLAEICCSQWDTLFDPRQGGVLFEVDSSPFLSMDLVPYLVYIPLTPGVLFEDDLPPSGWKPLSSKLKNPISNLVHIPLTPVRGSCLILIINTIVPPLTQQEGPVSLHQNR